MEEAFSELGFAICCEHNVTKDRIEELVKEAAEYREYPTSFKCLAFVFAGHGSNSIYDKKPRWRVSYN